MTIRFQGTNGALVALSPSAFHETVGVEYTRSLLLPAVVPSSFADACAKYGLFSKNSVSSAQLEGYRGRMESGYVAPTYIAMTSGEVGFGLYAYVELQRGEMVGEYAGLLSDAWVPQSGGEADFNPYLFKYPFETNYAIDARRFGNELRFVNHSSTHANVGRIYLMGVGIPHVIFVASELIKPNHQILLDYGAGYWGNKPVSDLVS